MGAKTIHHFRCLCASGGLGCTTRSAGQACLPVRTIRRVTDNLQNAGASDLDIKKCGPRAAGNLLARYCAWRTGRLGGV